MLPVPTVEKSRRTIILFLYSTPGHLSDRTEILVLKTEFAVRPDITPVEEIEIPVGGVSNVQCVCGIVPQMEVTVKEG